MRWIIGGGQFRFLVTPGIGLPKLSPEPLLYFVLFTVLCCAAGEGLRATEGLRPSIMKALTAT